MSTLLNFMFPGGWYFWNHDNTKLKRSFKFILFANGTAGWLWELTKLQQTCPSLTKWRLRTSSRYWKAPCLLDIAWTINGISTKLSRTDGPQNEIHPKLKIWLIERAKQVDCWIRSAVDVRDDGNFTIDNKMTAHFHWSPLVSILTMKRLRLLCW